MDTIFMNSENSKTFNPYKLLLNLTDKINLKRSDNLTDKINLKKSDKYVVLTNLSNYYTWKNFILQLHHQSSQNVRRTFF